MKKDRFYLAFDSVLLVNAGVITGFLYMLVHPILGRLMSDIDYADFAQLLKLLFVIGVPASALRVAMARYVAEYHHADTVEVWTTVVRRALRRISFWALAGLVLWTVLSPRIRSGLDASSTSSVVILGFIGLISVYGPIVHGTLQGSRYFGWYSASTICGAGTRVLLCAAAAVFVESVPSLMVAMALSMLCGFLVGAYPFRKVLAETKPIPDFDTGPIYRYLWPVLVGQAAVYLLVSLDMIFVKRFLVEEQYVVYQKVAILSQMVIFISQPIATAVFPRVVRSTKLSLLVGPMTIAALISVLGALALTLFSGLAMRLVYGETDPAYSALMQRYVWAALPFSMVLYIPQYLWARHQTRGVLWAIVPLIAYLATIGLHHETAEQMIASLAFGAWSAFIVLVAAVLVTRRRETKDINDDEQIKNPLP